MSLPSFSRDLDCLQTRSRQPRGHPPNFALLCDWVVWRPCEILGRDETPEIIYLRSDDTTLRWFTKEVLPELSSSFVLVTGSHDRPMPMGWAARTGLDWEGILGHPNLVAWFTENRDVTDNRIHPLRTCRRGSTGWPGRDSGRPRRSPLHAFGAENRDPIRSAVAGTTDRVTPAAPVGQVMTNGVCAAPNFLANASSHGRNPCCPMSSF